MTTLHQPVNSDAESDIKLTPLHILRPLGEFDLDPCAAPEPRPWSTARRMISLPEDGLATPWSGRVWCNPPYSEIDAWVSAMSVSVGTLLVYAKTETVWFSTVFGGATAILFLGQRVKFCRADGRPLHYSAPFPSILAAYGETDAAILSRSGIAGHYVRNQYIERKG